MNLYRVRYLDLRVVSTPDDIEPQSTVEKHSFHLVYGVDSILILISLQNTELRDDLFHWYLSFFTLFYYLFTCLVSLILLNTWQETGI